MYDILNRGPINSLFAISSMSVFGLQLHLFPEKAGGQNSRLGCLPVYLFYFNLK